MSEFLYPNVSQIGPKVIDPTQGKSGPQKPENIEGPSFEEVLQRLDLETSSPVKPLKFSAHALERMKSRGIHFNQETMKKISNAVNRAEAKGANHSLVLTGDAALIVSVKNRTVVTAMDRSQMNENVFTNIDSAVIANI